MESMASYLIETIKMPWNLHKTANLLPSTIHFYAVKVDEEEIAASKVQISSQIRCGVVRCECCHCGVFVDVVEIMKNNDRLRSHLKL